MKFRREADVRFRPERRYSIFAEGWLAPGYVDLHIHGNAGYDVMDDDSAALAGDRTVARAAWGHQLFPNHRHRSHGYDLASAGATRRCDRKARTERRCNKKDIDVDGTPSRPPVRHSSGRTGLSVMLVAACILHRICWGPTLALFEQFWQASRGRIRMMTIAPELKNAPPIGWARPRRLPSGPSLHSRPPQSAKSASFGSAFLQ